MATLKAILKQFKLKDRNSLVDAIKTESLEKLFKNKKGIELFSETSLANIKDPEVFKSRLKNLAWQIQCEESDLKEDYFNRMNWDNMQRSMYNVGRKDLREKKERLIQILTILKENKVI